MSRDTIRQMKRTLRAGTVSQAGDAQRMLAVEAALALLERSVRMRRRRLAVQRLTEAVRVGARVPDEHWLYCREAAAASRDTRVQALFVASAQTAQAAPSGVLHG
jgi:hypothetical protein